MQSEAGSSARKERTKKKQDMQGSKAHKTETAQESGLDKHSVIYKSCANIVLPAVLVLNQPICFTITV